jgi:ribose transport system substrate-binding protein
MKVRVWIGIALVTAIVVAGCGSSSSGTGTGTGTGTGSGAQSTAGVSSSVSAARAFTANYETVRSNGTVPKLSGKPPTGETIAVLTCPLQACQQTTSGAVAGAKALGWKVDYVTYQLTPTGYQQVFNNLVQSPPKALTFIAAFPMSTIASQLTKLRAAGTHIVVLSPQQPFSPTAQISAVLQGPPEFTQGGVVAANAIVADAGGKTSATVVTDPSYGVFAPATAAFKSTMAKLCPTCTVGTLNISLANPAAQTDAAVANYLRQNPSVKYLFFVIGDAVAGVPAALSSDGLSGTKIISFTPDLSNISDVASGTEWATIQNENATSGWRAVDALARMSIGEGVGSERDPAGYVRLITKANVVPGKLPGTPGTPSAFLAAWGVK